jgi:multiple sugar transport system ATP-binding protein
MSNISLKHVSKSFGEQTAVIDMSLDIKDGEFIVLLGPTGAGKTTTLRLIAGLEKPDKGTIEIDGQNVNDMPSANRNVCFIFQQYSLYPHYTVYDNIAFPLRSPLHNFSKKDIESRVHEVAKMLKIDHKLKNKATQLSGGEMQRVAIGRALVRDPSVFLMDEPLSSLDAKMRDELRIELKRIQQDLNASILYVTHDQTEALTLADRIGILQEGNLIQIGTPREIYKEPINAYVARSLGSPTINIVNADLFIFENMPEKTAYIGIRPEDIRISTKDGIKAKVLTIECLGAETNVLLESGIYKIYCLIDDNDIGIKEGDEVFVSANQERVIFFDKNENNIKTM